MTEESARLRLPYLSAAQAQKHVTHNEALTLLDTLVQLAVLDKDLTEPPADPEEGDCYLVAAPATGDWIGWDKRIARFIDGTWRSYLPGTGGGAGWLAWVMDEDAMYRFDGTDWALAGIEGPAGPAGATGAQGPTGAVGPAGATSLTICRLVATSDLDLASELEDGDTVDGVTLVEGDRVLVAGQTDDSENGVYLVPASGAASRDPGFAAFDDHAGVYFSVMEGSANADTLWRCTSNRGGTIDASGLAIAEFTSGGGGMPPSIQYFTSPGAHIYTPSPGVKAIRVTIQGAGGGGGGSSSGNAGQGGGSGGICRKRILAASLGATETVTIGTGGTAAANTAGGTGGAASFGSHCTANGGVGGLAGTGLPGAGGTATGGNFNSSGNPGFRSGQSGLIGGNGGPGMFGGGAAGGGGSVSGFNGTNGGGGGGGGSVAGTSGGTGGNGWAEIEEYF